MTELEYRSHLARCMLELAELDPFALYKDTGWRVALLKVITLDAFERVIEGKLG